MQQANRPIGVMDSGVGGLTTVRELQALCPGEDIIYYGDSANCPYGNRDQEDILRLSRKTLDFLSGQNVKAVAIACNTISTLVELMAPHYDFPIIGIVAPTAETVAKSGLREVGVFATEFTILTKNYDKLIKAIDPTIGVHGKGSPNLAQLVDRGDFDMEAIEAEIAAELGQLMEAHQLEQVVLGCTHFPIVVDVFEKCFPGVNYINPALEQARAVVLLLEEQGQGSGQSEGKLKVHTSGDPAVYAALAQRLGLRVTGDIEQRHL